MRDPKWGDLYLGTVSLFAALCDFTAFRTNAHAPDREAFTELFIIFDGGTELRARLGSVAEITVISGPGINKQFSSAYTPTNPRKVVPDRLLTGARPLSLRDT